MFPTVISPGGSESMQYAYGTAHTPRHRVDILSADTDSLI